METITYIIQLLWHILSLVFFFLVLPGGIVSLCIEGRYCRTFWDYLRTFLGGCAAAILWASIPALPLLVFSGVCSICIYVVCYYILPLFT
jgi:hypothetical protein